MTICTKDRKSLLGAIVGATDSGCLVRLTPLGECVNKSILIANKDNVQIDIDKYVIMPNHIHLIPRAKILASKGIFAIPTNTVSYLAVLPRRRWARVKGL